MSGTVDFKARSLTRRGTRATQPAATAVAEGTLYFVTDERLLERSNGSAWQNISLGDASGQIVFPATQNPSANANTLDDYEEGTWTATDASGAGLTFSGVVGYYTKIGRQVFCGFALQYPVTASALGAAVTGLPFVPGNVEANRGSVSVTSDSGLNLTTIINSGAVTATIFPAGSFSPIQNSSLSNKFMFISFQYYST
jgi:hypothetical protein